MAWYRHNRNITHEVFFDGTTIDGSRLEKGMRDIEGAFNEVPIGDMAQRFIPVQYHAGFQPTPDMVLFTHRFPWLGARNEAAVDTVGTLPADAPFNDLRLKGTMVPGIMLVNSGAPRVGTQWAWSRTLAFKRPVVLDAVSVLMQINDSAAAGVPYQGTVGDPAVVPPYTYTSPPAPGHVVGGDTADVSVIVDIWNPTTPEDAEMTDVEYTRHRWVINNELFTLVASDATNTGPAWDDMLPVFETASRGDCKSLTGRLLEESDLNIPLPAGSKLRMSIVIPEYDRVIVGTSSWGQVPWAVQAWNSTITVLEEVRSL